MWQAGLSGAICLATLVVSALAADAPAPRTSLDQGFRLLYNLDFDQAHQVFLSWQYEHPQDPVGPTAEAAGILFSEFHRLGVLEGQFYENDKKFLDRDKRDPDTGVRDRFNAALARAQSVASSSSRHQRQGPRCAICHDAFVRTAGRLRCLD